MRSTDFQQLLMRSAVIALACDGNVDQAEIEVVQRLVANEIYFLGYDFQYPFEIYLDQIKTQGISAVEEYLTELKDAPINPRQKILLVEVLLRVMDADNQWAQNEKAFLHMVLDRIQLPLEDLMLNFPKHSDILSTDHSRSFDDSFKGILSA